MAGWKPGQLLLLVTLIAGAIFSCSASSGSEQSHSEGISVQDAAASRKLLAQWATIITTHQIPKADQASLKFVEDYAVTVHPLINDDYPLPVLLGKSEENFGDYGPPSGNPPTHVDPPAPEFPAAVKNFQVENSRVDYDPPSANPPEGDHNRPSSDVVVDYAAAGPDYPAPAFMNLDGDNFDVDYALPRANAPDVFHEYPSPPLMNLDVEKSTTDYGSDGPNNPDVDHNNPPPALLNLDDANFTPDHALARANALDVDHDHSPPSLIS